MTGNLQPLDQKFPIVHANGTPTRYFIEWAQQKQIDIGGSITAAEALEIVQQYLAEFYTVQEILNQITTVRGSILFRGATLWQALAPGTSGHFLKTNGAGADPAWAAGGGGGSNERTRVVPVVANFTLDNAGTASMADSTYGLILTVPTVGTQMRVVRSNTAPPATPYSMIVRAAPVSPYSSGGIYQRCLIARNSTSGRIIIYGDYNSGQHLVQRWTGYATFSANALAPINAFHMDQLPWMRMRNDGTNLIFGRSPDGNTWAEFHTEPLATFLTATGGTLDQIAFGTMMNGLGSTSVASFQSYEVV